MKKLIRRIKMWWWKKHNPEKYYKEYWNDVAKRFSESCRRVTLSMAALSKALKEYNDETTKKERNPNGNKTNR